MWEVPMKIYHYPRCQKSRQALSILEDNGIEPEIIKYRKNPPSADELKSILQKLGMSAKDIIRTSEDEYKEYYKGKDLSEDEWIQAIVEHPKLLQRPIVVDGDKAVLGRPPENVRELL